jgi:hypothetical protein
MERSEDLRQRARTGIELLRPHPHRGDLIAAGVVPFTVALLLINLRLDGPWGSGVFLVLDALAVALVLGMAVLAPLEEARPRAYQTMLMLCGLVLLFVTLLRLAQVLGAGEPLGRAGNAFWILTAVTAAAVWLARERRSAICLLVGAITGIFAALAFVEWVFDPTGPGTTRWILLLLSLALLTGALVLRDRRRRESVYLVDSAGFAILVLGVTWLGELIFGLLPFAAGVSDGGPGAGWKLVLLAAGLGLVAFAGVDREAGPGYLGALVLLVFVVLVGIPGDGGASLWFWPAVLLLAGGAMIGAGLRPREPLPPEPPPPGRASDAPAQQPVPAPFRGAGASRAAEAPAAPAPREAAPPAPSKPAAAPAPPAPREPAAEPAVDPHPTRPQPPVDPPQPVADDPPAEPEPPAKPDPPAHGSLWARADPGEAPTRQHRAVGDDAGPDEAPTQADPPRTLPRSPGQTRR